MFECTRCGRTYEPEGFESTGTFYTLCEECGEEVLREGEIRKMETEMEYVIRHTIGRESTIREIGLLRERYHIANATGRMVEG